MRGKEKVQNQLIDESVEACARIAELEGSEVEYRRPEEVLRECEQRLQAILDHSPAVIYVKDLQGRYFLINRQPQTRRPRWATGGLWKRRPCRGSRPPDRDELRCHTDPARHHYRRGPCICRLRDPFSDDRCSRFQVAQSSVLHRGRRGRLRRCLSSGACLSALARKDAITVGQLGTTGWHEDRY